MAARRAAPVVATGPPTTSAWPKRYLWLVGGARGQEMRHSAGALRAQAFIVGGDDQSSGMPMSASTQLDRSAAGPGRSRWPGLRRQKVTVSAARRGSAEDGTGGAVDTGRHVDRDDRPIRGRQRLDHRQRRSPSSGRARPAPNRASTTSSAPSSARRRQRLDRPRASCAAAQAASPFSASPSHQARHAERASRRDAAAGPRPSRRRHCCRGRTAPAPAAARTAR